MTVDETNLSMIRGDTESITVSITDEETSEHIDLITGNDTVYFTIKLNTHVETKVLQKILTEFDIDGNAIIEINHEDTASLPYKTYRYDIQWVDSSGRVRTIIAPSLFTLEPEVTFE